MILIAKNQTAGNLVLNKLSVPDRTIPASGQVTLTDFNSITEIQNDEELATYITNNQVLLNDGTNDLTKEESQNISTPPATTSNPQIETTTVTTGGATNSGKHLVLDAAGKAEGRELGVDGTKLDTIDNNADVTADNPPQAHNSSHQDSGSDEISVAGLSGELADPQPVKDHDLSGSDHNNTTLAALNTKISDATLDDSSTARTPTSHASSHQDGGGDEIGVAGLSGELADPQPVKTHDLSGSDHNNTTLAALNAKVSDATLIDTGDSRLSDSRNPTGTASGQLGGGYPNPDVRGIRETAGPTLLAVGAIADGQNLVRSGNQLIGQSGSIPGSHATTHENGGVDEIDVGGLSGTLTDDQPPAAHTIGGSKHGTSTLAELNTKVSDATLDDSGDSRDPNAHSVGGAAHSASTLAQLNSKISDATLDDAGDSRDPNSHGLAGAEHSTATLAELNTKVSDATLDDSGGSRDPNAHAFAGAEHTTSTLAQLNSKISDATLDSTTGTRDPNEHGLGGADHSNTTLAALNAKVSDATLDDSSDARDPNAHSASHQNGGADEIGVAGLSGELADPQPVKTHDLSGSDHNSTTLAALNLKVSDATLDDSGDTRDPNTHAFAGAEHSASTIANVNSKVSDATLIDTGDSRLSDSRAPSGSASGQLGGTYPSPDVRGVRETGGPTLLTVGAISDGQNVVRSGNQIVGQTGSTPGSHATTHENGGVDEIDVGGLSGELADPQPVKAHDLSGSDHNNTTLAALNTKISDATLDDSSDPRDPNSHAFAGDEHSVSALLQVNSKISDATLDDSGDPRNPNAHSASHQNNGGDEISVVGLSGLLADPQDPTSHAVGGSAHSASTLAQINALVSDATLDGTTDLRDPNSHAFAGADHTASTLAQLNSKVSDATLDDAGDSRNPNTHNTSHQNGGGDEISVAGLSGLLADAQTPAAHAFAGADHTTSTLAQVNAKISDATLDDSSDTRDPNTHAASHQNGGGDEISVVGLSGELADAQPPKTHATSHQNGGADEVATATPAANAIPKADGSGTLDSWVNHTDANAIHDNVSAEISAITEKVTPVSADLIVIEDSAAANAKKRVQIGNLPGGGSSVFGQDFQEALSAARSTTTSTTFQNKLTVTTPALTGKYRVAWHAIIDQSSISDAVEAQLYNNTDAAVVGAINQHEPKDPNNRIQVSGFAFIDFTGAAKSFIIQYRQQGGNTAGIQDARIEIWRVS